MELVHADLQNWINTNQLLEVEYIIPKKGRSKLKGRLLQYRPEDEVVIFYVDDSKSVITLQLRQIDRIIV